MRLKDVVALVSDKTEDNTLPYIGLENIVSWNASFVKTESSIEGTNSVFKAGDVLFGKLRPYLAKAYIPMSDGICSTEFLVLRPKRGIHERFLLYYILSPSFISVIKNLVTGVKMPRTDWATFGDMKIDLPALPEQRAIVSYLDEKAAAIDRKVALLEKKLAAFKRLKTSIINRAVTRGLDPNGKLKDSGVDWIGQVPEGWEVRRVKNDYFLKGRIGWQGLKAEEFIDDGPWLITGTDFVKGRINWETCYHVSEQRYYQDVGLQVREGDLLVTKDGTVGKLAYIDYVPGLCSLNSHLLLMRPLVSSRVDNKYMFRLLSSNVFRHYIEYESNGSTMQSLSQEAVSRFLYCAPAVAVQREIAAYLDAECAKIDKAAAIAEKQINAYRRLKRSLINEVVTGKRKVA